MAPGWDPQAYLAYGDERARPFGDLLVRVGATDPDRVVDLGCGPGNLTASLLRRWPRARVHGVDSSPEMVARACEQGAGGTGGDAHSAGGQGEDARGGGGRVSGGLSFELADLRDFRPAAPVDVLLSNAALQWVPDHVDLLDRLVGLLAPGGWLALQVPGNFGEPSHVLLRELADDPRFRPHTAAVAWPGSHSPHTYLRRLAGLGCRVEAWETTYLHVLTGTDPVLRWISSTGARPVLEALPERLREEFEREYAAALRAAYPAEALGTVLPFRRVFAVAQTR